MARVLVTGVSGYVGQHVAAELLRRGFEVVGTVRSLDKSEQTRVSIGRVASVDKLSFAVADLLADSGWAEAMAGCQFVMHVASPFILAEPRDENVLIRPAVEGTQRVLLAAKEAGVRRVILTSSVVAMTSGLPNGTYGPEAWSDMSVNIGAYAKSKTLAEMAAWEIVKDASVELVAINAGFILGPPIGDARDGQSVAMISDLLAGKMPMIPDVAMGMVDVRDVARLHADALEVEGAAGKRFIAASEQPVEMGHVAMVLREAGYKKVPSRRAPNLAIKFMSLFDREAKGMLPQLGKKIAYDVKSTYDVLGWQPTRLETTLVEMATSLTR